MTGILLNLAETTRIDISHDMKSIQVLQRVEELLGSVRGGGWDIFQNFINQAQKIDFGLQIEMNFRSVRWGSKEK